MINQQEYEKLKKDKKDGYEWVAKDKSEWVFAYTTKPKNHYVFWFCNGGVRVVSVEGLTFDVLSRDDEEPRKIDELIEEYEGHKNKVGPHPVHKPSHYLGDKGMEMRDVQKNFAPRYAKYGGLAVSDVKDIFKYIGRAPLKNGVQDLHKAKKHLEWLIKRVEGAD